MNRYRIDSMKYDPRVNGKTGASGFKMNDWAQPYSNSPPSSRYGEDDASSVTLSRQRRSRLDNDISEPLRGPIVVPPMARPASRKTNKHANGAMNNGSVRGHNSTFNGYDLHPHQRAHYNSSRGPNESFSGIYAPSRNISGYSSDFFNGRSGVGMLPNKMREPRRPRSTAAEKYTESVVKNRHGFGGYESGEFSTSDDNQSNRRRASDEESEQDEEEEEEMRNYYMEARRAQGSRSVTNNMMSEQYDGEDEKYYYGVVKLGAQMVDHVMRTMPPSDGYYKLKPIERVAYLYYCAVYNKPYQNIMEFHKIFNREFYKFVCAGDSDDLALFKICKSMQDQFQAKQLEESRLAYEKAKREAAESEKLDFNVHRLTDPEDHRVAISEPEEVLNFGPLHYHSCLQFATIGVGGKLVIIRPAGTVDPISGNVLSSTNVHVDDLKSLLHSDEQSGKVIESVQNFKGPLIAGQTPTHSVRLYIQRQIDSLRLVRNAGDVKKSEVVDALLIWQLLEIMVQQHGRVTGPDVATLLQNASEELLEKTGVAESGVSEAIHKADAKERFNKFLLGGHINEAVESAISDGLYADAMTLIRRLHPNDVKKIEEIETRFMNLRSIDDPFATLVAVASDQPPPILTNAAFDDDNNWKRHAAIVLANLNSQTAMKTIYHLGLLLAKRERHCAADFCLLVVCILAGYDPFIPLGHSDGEEKSRKHIGLVHSGSHLLNRVDGLSGTAGFSFTDLHATDIFDYALRLGNNNADSPLAKSVDYQLSRIEYAKKLSSYGGFATDAFRYCTEVARSLWFHISGFDKSSLLDLCDLADSLQYVAAATSGEIEWIGTLKMMLENTAITPVSQSPQLQHPNEENNLTTEAKNWHDDHQAPLEIPKKAYSRPDEYVAAAAHKVEYQSSDRLKSHKNPPPSVTEPSAISVSSESFATSSESTITSGSKSSTTVTGSSSRTSAVQAPPAAPKMESPSLPTASVHPVASVPEKRTSPDFFTPISAPPPQPQIPTTPPPPSKSQPVPMPSAAIAADVAKSPRTELEDIWGSEPTFTPSAAPPMPQIPSMPVPQVPKSAPTPASLPPMNSQPSVPNTKTAPPPTSKKDITSPKNDRKSSKGWFASITDKVIKSIPSSNAMILPDDSKPSIVWDPVKQKYVGSGVEEEVAAPPPPVMSAPHLSGGPPDSNKSSTNSLRSARSGFGSRYLQAGMATTQTAAPSSGASPLMPPTMMPPMMPMPTSFGFIPAAVEDDSSEYADPFSGAANPTVPSESGSCPDSAQ